MLRTLPAVLVALCCAVGCGKQHPVGDAGVEADAGTPVVDAGRPAGEGPPTGYSLAVEQPPNPSSTRTGLSVSMVLDSNDQPVIAYVVEDPNGDGVLQDTAVMFTRWNGESRSWETPKLIEVVGQIELAAPHRQISLARDASTGRLGLAYLTSARQVRLATSDNEGASWSLRDLAPAGTKAHSDPSLALAGGNIDAAYWSEDALCDGVGCRASIFYDRIPATGAASHQGVELATALEETPQFPLSLAVDANGEAGLAYFIRTHSTPDFELRFWRPHSSTVATVLQSAQPQPIVPSVSLAFEGDKPRVAYHLAGADPLVELRYSAANDSRGTQWNSPVAVPRNGSSANPDSTRWFQALAVDSGGAVAIAAFYGFSAAAPQMYGGPKLARSAHGTDFTVTSPDLGRVFGSAGMWANLAYTRAHKLTGVFLYDINGNPSIKPGVVLWREL